MKKLLLKIMRTIRFLFYRNLNIEEQLTIASFIDNKSLLSLYWKMAKPDRQHSFEVFKRTKKQTNDKELLLLSLFHDIGKSKIDAGLFFRIFTDLGLIKSIKSKTYLEHEEAGLSILQENNIDKSIIEFYKNNLLNQKNIILNKTDF